MLKLFNLAIDIGETHTQTRRVLSASINFGNCGCVHLVFWRKSAAKGALIGYIVSVVLSVIYVVVMFVVSAFLLMY